MTNRVLATVFALLLYANIDVLAASAAALCLRILMVMAQDMKLLWLAPLTMGSSFSCENISLSEKAALAGSFAN